MGDHAGRLGAASFLCPRPVWCGVVCVAVGGHTHGKVGCCCIFFVCAPRDVSVHTGTLGAAASFARVCERGGEACEVSEACEAEGEACV